MKRLALILSALLLPFGALAQDIHALTADGKCLPAFTSHGGITDGKVWTVRYCRPPSAERDKRVWWYSYITITDPTALPAGVGAVVDAYQAKQLRKVVDLGEALINKPLTDPSFAKAYAAAQEAAAAKAIPSYASAIGGWPCDCRTRKTVVNGATMCPLASQPDGASAVCRGK